MNTISMLLASACAIAIGQSAYAGGYVAPVIPLDPVVIQSKPEFTWTGPYAGAFVGHSKLNMRGTREVTETETETIFHPEVVEEVIVDIIEHPELTETVVVDTIEHDAVIEVIEHPKETKEVHHDAITKEVLVGEEKLWVPTAPEDMFPGCHFGNMTCPVPDGNGGWKTEKFYETKVIKDAWVETIVVKDAWTETRVVEEAWVEEITEDRVVQEAWTEVVTDEVVTQEAWTEEVVTTWTETVRDAFKDNANTYGIFGGYRHQLNNGFVVGAEAHYARTSDVKANFTDDADAEPQSFNINTKGIELQAGYALNRLLPYVSVGYANVGGEGAATAAVGADYAVTDRFFVGAKWTYYDIGRLDNGYEADMNMLSLRAGIKF